MARAFAAVALLVFACLLFRAVRVDLAGDYLDPVSHIRAQDESLYASSAIHMATQGNWLTPHFMGRLALYKPPLLIWLSALSAKIAGVSHFALRLPVALICALAAGLVFWWAAEMRSWQAGACAALLLASNHLWHVLGSMCLTDGLLVAFYTAAMYCLFADPWLDSRIAFWGFAGSVGAAILTKSVAGCLPLPILGLYWLLSPRKQRPAFLRICAVGIAALAIAAPWYVYQFAVHHRWFWTEHVAVEILGYGGGAPPQTSEENQALFYLMRMLRIDPVLTALAVVAVPGFFADLRRRSAPAVLLFCWIAGILGAVFFWQYRNVTYLLPVVPAVAILATAWGALGEVRSAKWLLAVAIAAFAIKVATPDAPWGVSFQRGTIVTNAPMLSEYCELRRANDLVLVEPEDELYGSVLPVPRVRYYHIGAMPVTGRYGMDFASMGIVATSQQFDDFDRWMPEFRRNLHDWGLDTTAPVGTMIIGATPADLARNIRTHPATDFFLPERYKEAVAGSLVDHEVVASPPGRFFLLARQIKLAPPPKWSCRP
jgi:hypothetical protein